jgi:hypothetical protein
MRRRSTDHDPSGDDEAADIVGPTGEEMPVARHAGLDPPPPALPSDGHAAPPGGSRLARFVERLARVWRHDG